MTNGISNFQAVLSSPFPYPEGVLLQTEKISQHGVRPPPSPTPRAPLFDYAVQLGPSVGPWGLGKLSDGHCSQAGRQPASTVATTVSGGLPPGLWNTGYIDRGLRSPCGERGSRAESGAWRGRGRRRRCAARCRPRHHARAERRPKERVYKPLRRKECGFEVHGSLSPKRSARACLVS